jgi:hypothetical protein
MPSAAARPTMLATRRPAKGARNERYQQSKKTTLIRAGKVRRGEIPPEPPPADSVAGQILRAGRRRRGEETTAQELAVEADADTPVVALARKIVDAGRRRRGEIK